MEQTPSERTAGTVRAELARRKITGRDFAKALGWSPSTAWRRLNGSTPLKLNELTKVAAFLDIPVTDLLGEQDVAA